MSRTGTGPFSADGKLVIAVTDSDDSTRTAKAWEVSGLKKPKVRYTLPSGWEAKFFLTRRETPVSLARPSRRPPPSPRIPHRPPNGAVRRTPAPPGTAQDALTGGAAPWRRWRVHALRAPGEERGGGYGSHRRGEWGSIPTTVGRHTPPRHFLFP